jgi:hypothetical protein
VQTHAARARRSAGVTKPSRDGHAAVLISARMDYGIFANDGSPTRELEREVLGRVDLAGEADADG